MVRLAISAHRWAVMPAKEERRTPVSQDIPRSDGMADIDRAHLPIRRPSFAGVVRCRTSCETTATAPAVEAAVTRAIKKVVGEATDSHIKAFKAALADASAKMAAS